MSGDTNNSSDTFVRDHGDAGCTVTLALASSLVPAAGASDSVLVMASAECAWTSVSNEPNWLSVTGGSSGTGFGRVDYRVAANAGATRTGTITIGGQHVRDSAVEPDDADGAGEAGRACGGWNSRGPALDHPARRAGADRLGARGGAYLREVLASIPTGSTAPMFTLVAPTGLFYAQLPTPVLRTAGHADEHPRGRQHRQGDNRPQQGAAGN